MNPEDPTAILQHAVASLLPKAIALLERAESLLEELNAKLDRLETPKILPEWASQQSAQTRQTESKLDHFKKLEPNAGWKERHLDAKFQY